MATREFTARIVLNEVNATIAAWEKVRDQEREELVHRVHMRRLQLLELPILGKFFQLFLTTLTDEEAVELAKQEWGWHSYGHKIDQLRELAQLAESNWADSRVMVMSEAEHKLMVERPKSED